MQVNRRDVLKGLAALPLVGVIAAPDFRRQVAHVNARRLNCLVNEWPAEIDGAKWRAMRNVMTAAEAEEKHALPPGYLTRHA